MSYILDALHKSEQERQQQQDTPSLYVATDNPKRKPSLIWVLAIPTVVVLVAIAVFIGYQLQLSSQEPTPVTTMKPSIKSDTPTATPLTPSAVAPTTVPHTSNVPELSELPWSFRNQVPDIDYTAHVYSENGGTGFVILNGSMRYEGYNLSTGVSVKEILPEGVVLEYQGRQFRLLAMKSWRQR